MNLTATPPTRPRALPQIRREMLTTCDYATESFLDLPFDEYQMLESRLSGIGESNGSLELAIQAMQWDVSVLTEHDPMLVWVSAEMCDLIEAIAPTIPDDVLVADLGTQPAPAGLVAFARPMNDVSVHGEPITVDAVVWGPVHISDTPGVDTGVGMSSWVCSPPVAVIKNADVWVTLGRTDWMDDEPVGAMTDTHLSHGCAYSNGALNYLESAVIDRRRMAALWHLLNSHITERTVYRPNPKKARKRGHAKADDVVVIHLRRPHGESRPTGEERSHDHSWLVRPHMRWQPCGPRNSQRKLILIAEHVKGDGPLKIRDRIFSLDR